MAEEKVITGALALIRVRGAVVGLMKSVRCQENFRRVRVGGLGTILPQEYSITEWEGTLSCEFMEIDFTKSGIPDAIKRDFANIASQALVNGSSFEDQLILDSDGVQVDIFKKVKDVMDARGIIKAKLKPFAIVRGCLIESDSFDISEGSIGGHSQSFKYLSPITRSI